MEDVTENAMTFDSVHALWVLEANRVSALEDQVKELRDRWLAEVARHEKNMTIISDRLLQEANERDWCDIYDDVIEDINARLDNAELKTRERDYVVSHTITVTRSRTIRAASEGRVQDYLSDDDEYDLDSYVFEGGAWTVDHRYEDTQIEVLD